ncbi:MAG: DNA polymerase III subunit delta [Pseudomonadota bacterium]|jgi:DNA polymerase-3 subunit delta|nr:DNA polymerase III subunit delta [Pseudomonadota bacterium]
MKLQGNGAERFAKKPDPACPFVLIFGEDEGVVADAANTLIKSWTADDPATVLTLDEDEVKREPAKLFDALEAVSLLGEGTIVRIRTKGEKLFSLIKEVLELPVERVVAKLVLQNGSLNTRSKLRTAFETSGHAAALHLFADSDADMSDLVRNYLQKNGVEIEAEALSEFVGGLPGHRSLANAEMEKLAVFAHDLGRPVTVTDVRALCETNADENARRAVLLALSGDAQLAQAEMDRVLDAGLSPISLVRMFEMEASRMIEAQALQGEGGAANVGMKLKPPVWKSDWPAFQSRLRKWPTPRLTRLIERLHDLELMAKSPGGAGLAEPATRELFIALYKAASKAA